MKIKNITMIFFELIMGSLLCISAYAQVYQGRVRTATIDEARHNFPPAVQLEAFKIGRMSLSCNLPDGSLVEISPVSDSDEFKFLAVSSTNGPLIVANERFINASDASYLAYSFYRECAMHALTKVKTKGPGNEDAYSNYLINTAECLAVIPAQKEALSEKTKLSFTRIAMQLHNEYGSGSSTSAELKRCSSASHVAKKLSYLKSR